MIKIALVGASCVGKTTVFRKLQEELRKNPSVRFVEEVAREYFRTHHVAVRDRLSPEVQDNISKQIVVNEQSIHATSARFIITDRSVIDPIIFIRTAGNIHQAERLFKRVRFLLKTYHTFLLFDPTGVPYTTDSVRKAPSQLRDKLHKKFLYFFKEKGIRYQLVSGSLEERVQQTKAAISVL